MEMRSSEPKLQASIQEAFSSDDRAFLLRATRHSFTATLYAFPAETTDRSLETLDRYEGPEFTRKRVYVTLRGGRRRAAWTYLLRNQPGKSARPVSSGRYQLKHGAA